MPMNFSVIGGATGAGGGPLGTLGAIGGGGAATMRGGGTGLGLNRNRLRSPSDGFGRSASRASRCTSGAFVCDDTAADPLLVPPSGVDRVVVDTVDGSRR